MKNAFEQWWPTSSYYTEGDSHALYLAKEAYSAGQKDYNFEEYSAHLQKSLLHSEELIFQLKQILKDRGIID